MFEGVSTLNLVILGKCLKSVKKIVSRMNFYVKVYRMFQQKWAEKWLDSGHHLIISKIKTIDMKWPNQDNIR